MLIDINTKHFLTEKVVLKTFKKWQSWLIVYLAHLGLITASPKQRRQINFAKAMYLHGKRA